MLQITYISTARGRVGTADLAGILARSRANNTRDGITGLLFYDGKRFLQALEGEPTKVEHAVARIRADQRHAAVVVLSRRDIDTREFGQWAMACRDLPADEDKMLERLGDLVQDASPAVRATFTSFAQVRRAA